MRRTLRGLLLLIIGLCPGFAFATELIQNLSVSPPPPAGGIYSNVCSPTTTSVTVSANYTGSSMHFWRLQYQAPSSQTWTTFASGSLTLPYTLSQLWQIGLLTHGQNTLRAQGCFDACCSNVLATSSTVLIDVSNNFSIALSNPAQINSATGGSVTLTSYVPCSIQESIYVTRPGNPTHVRDIITKVNRGSGSFNDTWNGLDNSSHILNDGGYTYIATAKVGSTTFTWDLSNILDACFDDHSQPVSVAPASPDPFNNVPLVLTYTPAYPARIYVWAGTEGSPGCSTPGNFCPVADDYEAATSYRATWTGVDGNGNYIIGGTFRGGVFNLDEVHNDYSPNTIVLYGTKPSLTNPGQTTNVAITPPAFSQSFAPQPVISFDVTTYTPETGLSAAITLTPVNLNVGSMNTSPPLVVKTKTIINIQTSGSPATAHVTWTWDGTSDNGTSAVAPGYYAVTVTVTDPLLNSASGQTLATVQW